MNYPQRIINSILDTVFPVICLGCGSFSTTNKKNYLCRPCIRLVLIKKDLECIGCRIKSPLGKTCVGCQNWSVDHLFVVSDYKNNALEKVIKAFKYRFVIDMIGPLSLLIKKYIFWLSNQKKFNIITEDPLIIPLPLHYRRLNWRGFNQAEVIAQSLADILQINLETDLLKREESRPQADIEIKEERIINAKGVYKIKQDLEKIKNKVVIIVDDICTTGATLNECARVLKEAGAKKVIGFVIARG